MDLLILEERRLLRYNLLFQLYRELFEGRSNKKQYLVKRISLSFLIFITCCII